MIVHVVRSGETLRQIANRYRVSLSSIVAANALPDPNRILIGQALIIPSANRQHVVRQGEALWQIAQNYGVSVQAIIQANQITNPNVVYPETVLIIPARTYVIQPRDNLRTIAQRFNTTVSEIVKLNSIQNPDVIYPGTRLIIPFPKRVIDVNAYTIHFGEAGGNEVREVGSHLTYVSPFGYSFNENGDLGNLSDEATIAAAIATGTIPMMCLTNFSVTEPGSQLAQTLLGNVDLQTKLLNNIVSLMRSKGYRGLNVDFENVYSADRERYNAFLQRAATRMHQEGFFLSTAVAPKTSSTQKGLLYEAHDYAAHGRIADFVILMTYEWGYRKGPPQAISPLNQMRRVIEYAVTVIPRNKIFMGFQLYARDWVLPHVQGSEAETFSMQEAVRRAVQHGSVIQYDETAQSPFYRYIDNQGRQHEVWFEDARSTLAKFSLVNDYGLRGISYWVLGYPFPQNWLLLDDRFIVRKL